MRTIVYIDSFNLYMGCLRHTPHKWLNLHALACHLLPNHDIQKIKFFTARVKARPSDPTQQARQQVYFRALRTITCLEFFFGKFSTQARYWPPVEPTLGVGLVNVWTTQEKGSDVNLATELIMDGVAGDYDQAVVISGDTDLLAPIRAVRQRLNLDVCVINPGRYSKQLQEIATTYIAITESDLIACQFAPTLRDKKGAFHKPPSW